jgi:glycosyltransferase involved in cell wall biosynthesis
VKKVSIIIPFYNCEFVNEAIESALNQTYKNIEVIVVNDGSTQYSEKIKPYLKKIKYIEKRNGGTASALNVGIQNATGEFFSWLSSDDIYEPYKTENQVSFMETNQLWASYANYYLINERGKITSPPIGVDFPKVSQFLKRMRRGCVINGCTVMLRMSIFKEFGLFDESLPFTHDYDYWLRILHKHHFYFYNEPLVKYRVHENMGTKKHSEQIRKELRATIKKHRPKMNEAIRFALMYNL